MKLALSSAKTMLFRAASTVVLIALVVMTVNAAFVAFPSQARSESVTYKDCCGQDALPACPTSCPNPDCSRCHCPIAALFGAPMALLSPVVNSAVFGDGEEYLPDPPPKSIFHPPR
jgi:hypothetical protein